MNNTTSDEHSVDKPLDQNANPAEVNEAAVDGNDTPDPEDNPPELEEASSTDDGNEKKMTLGDSSSDLREKMDRMSSMFNGRQGKTCRRKQASH